MPTRALSLLCVSALLAACSSSGGRRPPGGRDTGVPDSGMDAVTPTDTRPPPSDVPMIDPFDPDAACGTSAVPTERLPGSLLFVFDQSGSMDNPPGGGDSGPTKWDIAGGGINSVLATTSDDLNAGMLLFPEGGDCAVPSTPQVPIGPLSTTRSQIASQLSSTPNGGTTPIFAALRAGWSYLDTIDTTGQKGVVVVTDGAENCDEDDEDAIMAEAAMQNDTKNYLTFVVGLTTSNNTLSGLAYNGGTARNDTCLPECTSPLCNSSADCPGGANCFGAMTILGISVPGQCGCNTDADCVSPQRCQSLPIIGNQCTGDANCCHYDATESDFQAEFQAAMEDIARRFLDSCVFDVPKEDPASFDPTLVNVGVTFEGEGRTVLGQSSDETIDSWNYTTPDNDSIIIQGPICDRLLDGAATVEIVVGCPTILI